MRKKLLFLRSLIFQTAQARDDIGEIVESLKWNEPAYSTIRPKSGSPIRINNHKKSQTTYAMYFICTTSLVDSFREKYGSKFKFEENRAILFDMADVIPIEELRDCISMALTYHLKKMNKL